MPIIDAITSWLSAAVAREATVEDVREERVELLSQHHFLEHIARWQSINLLPVNLLPLVLIGLCNLGRPSLGLTLTMVALNIASMIGIFRACQRLRAHDNPPAQHRLWRLYNVMSFASGMTWAGLMLPVAATLGKDIASTFVCVIIIATVSVTSMVIASRWIGFLAFASGFFVGLLPQTLYFIDEIGPIPLTATIFLAPVLWFLADAVYKQDRSLIRTQLEKEELTTELARALERAEHLATRDSLTGLYNRRAFEQVAQDLRSAMPCDPISMILIDLDHFKSINDLHGHACGDCVLQKSAQLILDALREMAAAERPGAAVARWGGEEFLILLPDCPEPKAMQLAERLREGFAGLSDPSWPVGLRVSGSFGVTSWRPGACLHQCINEADEAMYRAKRIGRNKVAVFGKADRQVRADGATAARLVNS